MAASATTSNKSGEPSLFMLASLIVPGLGQFLLGRHTRAILIFVTALLTGLLVNWSLVQQKVAVLPLGTLSTSWLWLPFIAFWVWNVLDVRLSMGRQPSGLLLPIAFIAIILYVIAWNVTEVKLNRLVERAGDAQRLATNLLNPDILTLRTLAGEDQICAWKCLWQYADDRLAGRAPAGAIRVSDNFMDIIGRVKPQLASSWQVRLGLAEPGSRPDTFVAGSMIETIAMGLMATIFSTILAVPVSFLAAHNIMSRVPGGNAVYYVSRTILNIVRAVDTIVWGLIVIVWVGLGTFAGVIALTIHSIAALGKLFSEEIEHIDPGPVEAVTATGGNLIQTIRFAVIPQIIPSFLSYALLRWDINMRSASVIGFVAGGGIGFFVIETVRLGGYQQYAAALWAVAVVIILVDWASARWRERLMSEEVSAEEKKPTNWTRLRTIFYVLLGIATFLFCWNVAEISIRSMLNPGKNFGRLLLDFISIDVTPKVLQLVIRQMLVTIFQAMLATTLGALVAFPFSFLAAKNLTGRSRLLIWLYYITRATLNILRSIEALLYVVIFVVWVGIGPFAGMLALAITSFALIGKLFSEAIENIDAGSIEAVTATGANRLQTIVYAIVPQIVPPFVSYLIYQWDINIRMATIIGFAGGGGIGLTLTTFFGSLQYHKAGTVVLFIVVVVAIMDFASAKLREKLV
jgi:phosphonate ABC transporter permease subunit PhnE